MTRFGQEVLRFRVEWWDGGGLFPAFSGVMILSSVGFNRDER